MGDDRAAKAVYERDGGHPELWNNIGDDLRQVYREKAAAVIPTDTRVTTITVGKGSTLLAERRFYQNTYLVDDDAGSVVVFVTDAAEVRGPSGRVQLRTADDVIEFASVDDMVAAVVDGEWVERPEDRDWKPALSQLREALSVYPKEAEKCR